MRNKQLLCILAIILLISIGLAVFAFRRSRVSSKNVSENTIPTAIPITKSPNATSILSMKRISQTTVEVNIDGGSKGISAVQLEISYDPVTLTNLTITQGTFFSDPLLLIKKVDPINKTIFLALAIRPGQQPQAGHGTVATISFTPNPGVTTQTQLQFTAQTKVTSEGIQESVLKESQGITLSL